jgi:drug/metabolite transporter (DMT)-like permease
MPRRKAIVYLLITVILWSTSGVLVKLLPSWNPLALNAVRSIIAAGVIWIYVRKPHFTWSFTQVGAAVAYVAANTCFIASTQLTTAANAIFLQYSAPLWVAIFGAWYLHERPKPVDWYAMAAIFVGMLLFFGDNLSLNGYVGNLLAIFGGISFAWMILLLRKQKDGSPVESVLLGNILAFLIGLPFLVGPWATMPAFSMQDWAILIFLGIFQLGIPFILYARAIQALTAVEAVLIQTLEPILNPIWVFLGVGETPGRFALLGAAIVLAAVTIRAIISSRQENAAVPLPTTAPTT